MAGLPPWMEDTPKKKRQKINQRSAKQEKEHAQRTGGRVQAGSGSSWRAPEDVRGKLDAEGGGYLDQLKSFATGRYTLSAKEWIKLRRNAHKDGREPRLIIEFPEQGVRLVVTEDDESEP